MQFRTELAALAVAGGAAVLALASTPALASSQAVTGPEIASGAIYGKPATANNPVWSLTWRGLVNTHGYFAPGSASPVKGQQRTFATSAGNLPVVVSATPTSSQSFDPKTCHFSSTTYVAFSVVHGQGTGAFAGTSGSGAVQVYFAGYAPRYTSGPMKGQCNTSPNAPELTNGAVDSLLLSAVLTK